MRWREEEDTCYLKMCAWLTGEGGREGRRKASSCINSLSSGSCGLVLQQWQMPTDVQFQAFWSEFSNHLLSPLLLATYTFYLVHFFSGDFCVHLI